jgi:hypothetical protein
MGNNGARENLLSFPGLSLRERYDYVRRKI